jgi:hypothetical protein
MRFLLIFFIVLLIALPVAFFGYPPLIEHSDGVCGALRRRVEDAASHDASGLLIVGKLYGSSSSEPSGAAFAEDQYPLLPAEVGCAIAYWKTAFDPPTAPSPVATQAAQAPASQAPPQTGGQGGILSSTVARDITPNGDPILPATTFSQPVDSVAIRVDYPQRDTGALRFYLLQGRTVMSPCAAHKGAPGIAWCKFDGQLRKGVYSILFTANNVSLGQFAFTVIGQ